MAAQQSSFDLNQFLATRTDAAKTIVGMARPGDRVVIMGARDDTLSQFARELLRQLG